MDRSQEAAQDASDAQEPSDAVTEADRPDKKSHNPGYRCRFAYPVQVFYEANLMRIQRGHVQLGHVEIGQRGLSGQPPARVRVIIDMSRSSSRPVIRSDAQ